MAWGQAPSFRTSSSFNSHSSPGGRGSYHSHFTDAETEAEVAGLESEAGFRVSAFKWSVDDV